MSKVGSVIILILLSLSSCMQNEPPLSHPPGTILYEARGTHQCQDDKQVGYTCEMFTGNITEPGCITAHQNMLERHCCNKVVVNNEYPTSGQSLKFTATCVRITPM